MRVLMQPTHRIGPQDPSTANTVISLGPGEELMSQKMYASLLGVSSHELYHTWNVKQIRPKELLPYDYTKENYSRMGYLYEGVTTYMGDLYLKRSDVFSDEAFFKTQEENLQKHFHNGGRHNLSVADSSFDTWLDGYVMGVPNRKVSIYTEGALCAFMLDVCFLEKSAGQLASSSASLSEAVSDSVNIDIPRALLDGAASA